MTEVCLVRWLSLDLTDDKSTLVNVMAWCCQATSQYLSQCLTIFMSPYGVTRPQWVNNSIILLIVTIWRKLTISYWNYYIFLSIQALCQNHLDGYSPAVSPRKVGGFSGLSLWGMARTFQRIVFLFLSRRRKRTKMMERGLFAAVNYFILPRWLGEPSHFAAYGSFIYVYFTLKLHQIQRFV